MTARTETRPWSIGDAFWTFVAGIVGAIIAVGIVGEAPTTRELFGIVVPAQMIGMIVAVLVLSPRREQLPLRFEITDSMGLLVGAGLQIGLSLALAFVLIVFFGGEGPTQEIVEAAGEALGAGEVGLVVLGAAVLAPIAEELMFRGVLLSALRNRWSDRVAYWGSATAFALVHLLDLNAILTVPALFVVGLVLARQVLRTGRLGKAILTHVGFNLVSIIALFLTVE